MTRDRLRFARTRTENNTPDEFYYRATMLEVIATLERVWNQCDASVAAGDENIPVLSACCA